MKRIPQGRITRLAIMTSSMNPLVMMAANSLKMAFPNTYLPRFKRISIIQKQVEAFAQIRHGLSLNEETEPFVQILYHDQYNDDDKIINWLKVLCKGLSISWVKHFYDTYLECGDVYVIEDNIIRDPTAIEWDDSAIRRGQGMNWASSNNPTAALRGLYEMLRRQQRYQRRMLNNDPHKHLIKVERAGENIAILNRAIAGH